MVISHASKGIYGQQYAGTLADQCRSSAAEKCAGADTYAIVLARQFHMREFWISIAGFDELTEPLVGQAGHERNAGALERREDFGCWRLN